MCKNNICAKTLEKIKKMITDNECTFINTFISIDNELIIEFKCDNDHECWIKYNHNMDIIFCKKCKNKENHKNNVIGSERNKKLIKFAEENKYVIMNLTIKTLSSNIVTIVCKNNHSKRIVLSDYKKYSCRECKNMDTLKEAKNIAIQRGGECLSEEYVNDKTYLDWICAYGHKWSTSLSKIKTDNRWCPECKVGVCEAICKEIFKILFDTEFVKIKPKWLKGLELDGYAKIGDMKIAFEYDGEQHYMFKTHWHKTIEKFEEMQERDRQKDLLCEENDVILIRIPYTVKKINFQKYIMDKCKENNIDIDYDETIDISSLDIYRKNDEKFNEIIKIIKEKNGTSEVKSYVNYEYEFEVTCSKNHTRKTSYNRLVYNGYWCRVCALSNSTIIIKKTVEDMEKLALSRGGKFLSETYDGSECEKLWLCEYGHEFERTPHSVSQGYWCIECQKIKAENKKKERIRLTTEKIEKLVAEYGGELLSDVENMSTPCLFQCSEGHEWETTPTLILNKKTWCKQCYLENKKKERKSKGKRERKRGGKKDE